MANRRSPSRADQFALLIACGRRCCLCFALQADFDVKRGQIAHIDHNRENSEMENLVFLCLPHHDEYDTIPSQTKKLMPEELARYKASLEEAVSQVRRQPVGISPAAPGPSPEGDELHQRDIRTLTRSLSTIHTDLLDDFFETGIHGTFLLDVSISHDQFQMTLGATSFHIHDKSLIDHTMAFADAWARCFSYGDYLFPAISSPDALQFQSPHMADNPADVREAFNGFQAAMVSAGEAFRRFVDFVIQAYPEIDIKETNAAAFKMLRTTWLDEDARNPT